MRRGKPLIIICTLALSVLVWVSCRHTAPDSRMAALTRTGLFNSLITKGTAFEQTNSDSLLIYADSAFAIAVSDGAALEIARARTLQAGGQRTKGNYADAVGFALQAIHVYDSLHNTILQVWTMNLLSTFYKEMGGEKGTREYLQKGLELSRAANRLAEKERYPVGVVMALNNEGIILRDLSRFTNRGDLMDSALGLYEQGIAIITKTGDGEEFLGMLYNNTSQVYNEHYHDYRKALDYLFKAVDFNRKRNKQNSLSFNYGNISDVYLQLKDYKKALMYAHEMLDVAVALKAPYRMVNAYRQLASVTKGMKKYDSSLYYTDIHNSISDSLDNITKTGQIAEMQAKFESEKKEAQITLLQHSNRVKSERLWMALGVSLILGVLLLLLGLQKRQVQRQKNRITEQSDRLQWLIKELHHRVKNNLQVVSGLLNMQGRRLKDEESKAAMKESRLRIQAMSLIHQRLYQMENLSAVNFKFYVDDLSGMLMLAYGYRPGEIELRLNIEKEFIDVDTAMPLALLVNEIFTNSFKYAFQEVSRPLLAVRLEETGSTLRLSISDNGPGLGSDAIQDGFGRKLIAVLARQLKAGYSEDTQGGSTYLFIIPLQKNSQ